jgi:tetratricopeptide (TPR) repeat protein
VDEKASVETAAEVRPPATAPDNSPVPSGRPTDPSSAAAGRHPALRLLLAPFRAFARRPARSLAALALLALIGVGFGLAGWFAWAEHHRRAARRAVEAGHNAAAIRHLKACRRVWPDDREVLILCTRVAWRSRAWPEAEALLDRYWQLYGDDEALVLERLLFQATRGGVESAGPALQARIDQDDPAAPLAREALIAGLMYRYRLPEADKQIEAWLKHDPDSTQALFARGKLQEEREQTSEALVTYRRLVEIDPEHDEGRLRMTTLLLLLSQGEEALTHLGYLRRKFPDHPEVLVQLAQALDLQARPDEARAALDECLRLDPNNARALAERGRIARRDGDGELAEDYLSRAVRLDPGNGDARNQYCLVLNQNGKKAEAAKQQEALRQVEDDVRRITDLLKGRLQTTPNDPAVYYEVAMIALRAGLTKEAHRWLLSALQVDPNHAPTHRTLAVYYQETGSPILAARHRAIAQRLGAGRPKDER